MANRDANESGVVVYPRLPVPAAPRAEVQAEGKRGGGGKWIALGIVAAAAGGAAVWFVQPIVAPDKRIAAAEQRASAAEDAARTQKTRADALEKSLDTAAKGRHDAEAQLAVAQVAQSELADKTSTEASRRKAAEAVQIRLRTFGATAIDGDDVHLQIPNASLFKPNDDELTERGRTGLSKLAAVLKDWPDRRVWVQGHTDEQPPSPKPAPQPKKGAKPAAVAPRVESSWELSAARALAVVHFFQDSGQVQPARLAALAFGQYAPASKKDKAGNRRIEIVVGPPRK